VFVDELEVAERVQLGIVSDEYLDPLHAARERRPLPEASAAK
jgi:hypothetical protein